jgi:hypothetical protein
MKKSLIIIIALLLFALLFSAEGQTEPYESYQSFVDPDFLNLTFYTMLVDPGHGGPAHGGGRKYGENGDYHGSYGYNDSLSEQWANLGVAFCLRDSLTQPGWWQQTVLMTRETQHDPDMTYIDAMWYRVQCGNYGNNGFPVSGECISIHFNGLTPTADQRTETWMSRYEQTDSGYYKVIAPKLSEKIVSSNHWNMNRFYPCIYSDPCYECYGDGGVKYEGEGPNEKKFVLRNWIPASTLIECSDISYDPDEEDFLEDSLGCHTQLIAGSIYWGWKSYKNNSGILTIKNISVDGGGGFFYVTHDGIEMSCNSPLVIVAPEGTQWRIDFVSPQIIGEPPAKNYFAHSVVECGDQWVLYENTQTVFYTVPNCSTHEITAYYTGGPYSVQLYSPNGGEYWRTCEQKNITWNASAGVDFTTRMNVYLSRNGGSDFDLIRADLPNTGSYSWKVSGLASSQCKIKIVAHDIAGNVASDISDENFTIQGPSVTVTSPNGWEIWHIDEQRNITWSSAYLCTTAYADIYLSRDGGSNYSPLISDLLNTGSYTWTVTGPYSTNCRIKVVVDDIFGNSAWDISNWNFSISDTGNNNPEIDTGLHCRYPYTECNECIKLGESFTLEVHAHDLDGDSMYYEWHCGPPPSGGHFSNGQNAMTTAQNYVVYTALSEKRKDYSDYLSVRVMDVRGGQTWTSGTLWIYDPATSCICGDVYDDSIVDGSDFVFLLNYLFFAGAPPPDPLETGDMNNDCVVDGGDLVYLLNYLYCYGPPPKCCWIH